MGNKHMTVFSRCFQKTGSYLTDLPTWIEEIRSGKYQEPVNRLRNLRSEGKSAQADEVKQTLPALAAAGNCMEGRQISRLKDRTGVAMFDQDKMSPEEVAHAAKVLREVPWVMAGHITSSGCGYRTFVKLGMVHPDRYREAYRQVAEAIGQLTGSPCDAATCDLCRLSYTSFDPDAFYHEDALPYPYPAECNPLNYVPATGDAYDDDPHLLCNRPFSPAGQEASSSIHTAGETEGRAERVDDVLCRFFKTHSFVEGSRHQTLLRLGQYACWRKLTRPEFEALKNEAEGLCPGFPVKELVQALEWGYTHGHSSPGETSSGSKVRCEPTPRACANYSSEKGEETPEEEEIQRNCPLFPDEVYEGLPSILERGLAAARTPRERDMLLMAMLANLSGCMPRTHMLYARHDYSPHFYFAAIAPAGSGKGVVSLAAGLGARVEQLCEEENERNYRDYCKKDFMWEMERRKAQKEDREPRWELQPEPFRRKVFQLPPNVSKSQFMLNLEVAGDDGMVCNCSEIDSFSSSLTSDCGKHAAELRMIFHHETVGQNYKIDGRPIVVRKPRLALCMSGTLMQLVRFINSKEDGMYSRMALLTGESSQEWLSAAPDPEGTLDAGALFESLAEEVCELFRFSQRSPLEVTFTARQWKEHDCRFGKAWQNVSVEEGEGNMAIVGRHGLIASRLGTVFTGMRRFESGFAVEKMDCSDDDFRRVMLITQCLLEHSLSLSTILPEYDRQRKPLSSFFRIRNAFLRMPQEFSFSEFIGMVEELGLSRASGVRALARLERNGETERVERALYRKCDTEKTGS